MKKLRRNKVKMLSMALISSAAATMLPAIIPNAVIAAETDTAVASTQSQYYDVYRYITFYYKNADGSTFLASKGAYQVVSLPSKTYEYTFAEAKAGDFISNIPSGWKIEDNVIPPVTVSYNKQPDEFIVYLVKDGSGTGNNESGSSENPGKYTITRNINFVYKNADGTTSPAGSTYQKATVSSPDTKYTFSKIKVSDLLEGDWSKWKPDKDTIPSVTATYKNPPADVTVYLSLNTDDYISDKKTVVRTINYYTLNNDGTKSFYSKYQDQVTFGAGSKKTDQYTFKDINITPPTGYKCDKTVIKGRTVTPAADNFTEEVIYTKRSDITTEKKTIWRKINFLDKNTGNNILGSQSQGITFSRQVYTEGGKTVVVSDWAKEGTFSEYTVPNIDGYVADRKTVDAQKVTPDSKDIEVNVYYDKIKAGFIEENGKVYYYSDGKKLTGTREINGIRYTFDGNGILISEPFNVNVGRKARALVDISGGWYTISAAANSSYVLDISGASTANKANLQLYRSNGTKAQKFYIQPLGNGEYTIFTGSSSKKSVLDVAGGKTSVKTNVQQYKSNGTIAQTWKIVYNEDGTLSFIAKNSGLALDIAGGKYVNKTNIQLYKVNFTKAQNFTLTRVSAP